MKTNKIRTPKNKSGFIISTLGKLALVTVLSLSALSSQALAEAPDNNKTDAENWPCVQRKILNLSPSAMWDGPSIEGIDDYYKDKTIRKLIPILVSRRIEMSDVETAIEKFAKAQPEDKRDRALTILFAGAFDTLNRKRRTVIRGIERYQKRQQARANKLETASTELTELRRIAGTSDEANLKAQQAQNKYDWDARVFQERQQNIPFACEVPVNIGQRAYALAQGIRAQMIN